ncbi:hypothetical protein CPU12_04715 [Malaciobacter molluscorum LMG 25693]|uniref:diguanylate cyclase n=1 Tax=Malaciobacter molluscorum LMG 25693 TaxID=870501 RepID=A0A2G1DJA8_9BACT|nr:diguanylate cyclase [Malaciobacter molluscorum]AXX91620.1 diguanylate cyclase [Malaciobacter molluscorum LMG 25693]PHO18585.1 hypothetical protein CPU12_04715 [Malaciobacter molluscorum LMG 25693]
MKRILKSKTILFLSIISLLTAIFLSFIYCLLVNNYLEIEKNQNIKYINTLINSFEENINSNSKRVDFLIKTNLDFSNQTRVKNTLKNLNFDLVFIKNNKKIDFIKKESLDEKQISIIKKEILEIHPDIINFNIIKEINNTLIYISKRQIKDNSYLYFIKQIDDNLLKNLGSIFSSINVQKNHILNKKKNLDFSSENFKRIDVYTNFNNKKIQNIISFYGINQDFLFSIITKNEATLSKEGKDTIYIFVAIVIIFLIILFYITHLYQKIVKEQNNELENKVEQRTHQIKATLTELEKVNLKLYDLAHTDFLTKTMNRRHFFMHANNAYNVAKEKKDELCAVMIDIDNFKRLNDTYGHDLGDKVLVSFSKCIKDCIDDDTIFGRLGGEEFAILFKNIPLDKAIGKVDYIRKSIEKIEIVTKNNIIKITASFGVADMKNASNIDEMLKKADKHLYHAKNSGKNLVRSRLNLL